MPITRLKGPRKMKKQGQTILIEKVNNEAEACVMRNETFREKVFNARIADREQRAITEGTKLFESKMIIDPRDGELKLTNNPVLLMHDMIKRTFDGSLQFVNDLGKGLSTKMDYCDDYFWIEKDNGEIKGI
jgi:hypothetical protein